MAYHFVRTGQGSGTGKIIFGLIMVLAFGSGAVAAWQEYLADVGGSAIPTIACGILALTGVGLIISGIRRNRRRVAFGRRAGDSDDLLKMIREDSESIQRQMESLRNQGVTGTYHVTKTTRTVTRTTAGGTTTTTETTHETSGDMPDSSDIVVSVTCASCGGITRLKIHQVGACRFCGSKIRG